MNFISKIISTDFDNLKRRIVKVLVKGKSDFQTAKEYSNFGDDSNPPAGTRALFMETGVKGKTVIVGYLIENKLAAVGEKRIFSQKSDGSISTFIWLKADGTMEVGGDTDFMVRFNKLKTGFDQLKSDYNDLVSAFNSHTHLTAGTGSPSPPTAVPSIIPVTPSSASIDDSKIDEIKTI